MLKVKYEIDRIYINYIYRTEFSDSKQKIVAHTFGIGGASLISSVHISHFPIPYRNNRFQIEIRNS